MDKILRYAAYAGIANLIMRIPLTVLWLSSLFGPLAGYLMMTNLILNVFYDMIGLIVSWGYKVLGEKTKNKLLQNVSLIGIISTFPFTAYTLIATFMKVDPLMNVMISAVTVIFFGLLSIVFGIAIYKLKDKFGNLATALAITSIISGIIGVTVLLTPLIVIIGFITSILGVMMLWKASDKY